MTKQDLTEVQGLLASGYARQRAMSCLLLKIVDPQSARSWLGDLVPQLTFCGDKTSQSKLNIAFTYRGLQRLIGPDELQGFPREFCEGMVTPHRQRVLGDLPGSPSDPEMWQWGGPNSEAIDVLLLAYELHTAALESRLGELRNDRRGVELIAERRTAALKNNKEHFGFRDGIAQPWVAGLHRNGMDRDGVALGELVLGYDDNTGVPEPAPELAANGSYLVLRQIVQRVTEFWNAFPDVSAEEKIRRAAKMVGRWPDGTPLTLSPDRPDPTKPLNDFDFAKSDAAGTACPLGSHIRRANPRDALLPDPAQSRHTVNRHRMLRRGRAFGLPAPPNTYPDNLEVRADDDAVGDTEERGLLFICLVASLSRQFEFGQHSWLNNPKFLNLSADTDPIASPVQWSGPDQKPFVTAQACPLRFRAQEREKYVHTVAGAYFLLPGKSAMRRLCQPPTMS
ncbi:MAG: peroxidase [Planctomycetota bacterium]|nr:peroxidase [Planctomycetota bacterium]